MAKQFNYKTQIKQATDTNQFYVDFPYRISNGLIQADMFVKFSLDGKPGRSRITEQAKTGEENRYIVELMDSTINDLGKTVGEEINLCIVPDHQAEPVTLTDAHPQPTNLSELFALLPAQQADILQGMLASLQNVLTDAQVEIIDRGVRLSTSSYQIELLLSLARIQMRLGREAIQALGERLKDYETDQASVYFYLTAPIPYALIQQIANYFAKEYR